MNVLVLVYTVGMVVGRTTVVVTYEVSAHNIL